MGKKKLSKGYTSKGQQRNVAKSTCKAMKKGRSVLDREEQAWESWKKGAPTPKIIQRELGIGPKTQYKQWYHQITSSSIGTNVIRWILGAKTVVEK